MTTGALIGGVVGAAVGLAFVVGSAWAGYRVAVARRTASLTTLK